MTGYCIGKRGLRKKLYWMDTLLEVKFSLIKSGRDAQFFATTCLVSLLLPHLSYWCLLQITTVAHFFASRMHFRSSSRMLKLWPTSWTRNYRNWPKKTPRGRTRYDFNIFFEDICLITIPSVTGGNLFYYVTFMSMMAPTIMNCDSRWESWLRHFSSHCNTLSR